jgi:mycofactocin system glycosyltransferase
MLSTQSAREELLPEGFAVCLDPEAHCGADGRTLLGGSPMRLLRLSEHAANLLAGLRAGAAAETRAARRLARRLCEAGLAHPLPPPGGPGAGDVTCAVAVRDDPDGLATLLASLETHQPPPGDAIIAEDGSRDPRAIADVARRAGARLIQRDIARGPAAARNEASQVTGSPIVAFVDADIEVTAGWLEPLLAHFADPAVAAVAPRVRAPAQGGTTLDRFERHCSPLDMGSLASPVGPRRRVRYVPSAALLFRRDALEELAGFDEDLRLGEDVDLIWRTVAAGWTVRYEPSVVVHHRNRPNWAALGRRRFGYGTSAAALAARHPGDAVPLEIAPWSLAAWLALVVGGRRGVPTAASITARRVRRLNESLAGRAEASIANSVHLVLRSHAASGRRAATAMRRTWLPLLLAATAWTWGRRLAVAALVVEPLVSWARGRPSLGPVRWILATLFSDAAYCAGVWRGALAARSAAALRPRLNRTTDGPAATRAGAATEDPNRRRDDGMTW